MKKFIIAPEIFGLFPNLNVGLVVATNLNNQAGGTETEKILRQAENQLELPDPITAHPHLQVWREAYKAFGAKPKKYQSSVEALARRASKGQPLPNINPAVNLYNALSLNYLFPLGAEDLSKTEGNICLKRAEGHENCQVLGDPEPKICAAGEVVYADDVGPLCRRFNWREVERCTLQTGTTQALFVLENLLPEDQTHAETALQELAQQLSDYCGASTTLHWLNKDNPEIIIL